METLILILIGLITGFEVAASQQRSEDVEHLEPTAVSACIESVDAIRIANLRDPAAPIWVLQSDKSLCDFATGRIVVISDLQN